MLHVLNGESTLELLKQTSIKGTFLVWKEMLMDGPVHETREKELDWKARSIYLKSRFGIDPKTYLSNMKAFLAALNGAAKQDSEITFWFEEDFFCQIHLIYLLAHLPTPFLKKGRAFVICPEKHLSIRIPASLERLYAGKLPLEAARITLARKVWKAYSLASPKGWAVLLKWSQGGKRFSVWPLLQKGLRCHLGRRPAPNGGLNPLEMSMLRALSHGPIGFPQFFRRTWIEPQVRPLGLGDMQIARYALDFAQQELPLIKIDGPGKSWTEGKPIVTKGWKLSLTPEGRALFEPAKPKETGLRSAISKTILRKKR